jgi:hypothetical protein
VLVLVVLVVAVREQLATRQRPLAQPIQVAALAVVVMHLLAAQAAQAAQVSSSLNTTHLHNPYSHSKVLAHG